MSSARIARAFGAVVVLAAALLAPAAPAAPERAARIGELIAQMDFDAARRELADASDADLALALEGARLALHEGDYDGAARRLARPELAKTDEGAMLAEIARGAARVTAATVAVVDDGAGVEVRYQDEADRALQPLLVETIVKAREALTRDLGVSWPRPTRVVVVRDLLSLSEVTGLPYASARTTGTVAVAKWGRVTLLSPRASRHGYPWRDTIAHELAHLAVTRATADRAPLWLQEGVAKREETRWRPPAPLDDTPRTDAVLARGMELKLDLPLDKLGASIAMLPSADQAMVAFAEVTSFVRYYVESNGEAALPKLLAELRTGKSVDAALAAASGADLRGWDVRWRAALARAPREALPSVFALGGPPPADHKDLRERVRLAELLFGRQHAAEARKELDRVKAADAFLDPSLRHLRATVLDALGRRGEARAAAGDPKDVASSFGPWWAIRGGFLRDVGDAPAAAASYGEALANDPLDVECACGAGAEKPDTSDALCEAARARGEPPLGRD